MTPPMRSRWRSPMRICAGNSHESIPSNLTVVLSLSKGACLIDTLRQAQGDAKVTIVTPIQPYCESAREDNFLHRRQQRKNVARPIGSNMRAGRRLLPVSRLPMSAGSVASDILHCKGGDGREGTIRGQAIACPPNARAILLGV